MAFMVFDDLFIIFNISALSVQTKEESQLKDENKVECKKWNAKGTYRKASSDREPTTHVNTLGAYGHVRI